jgi:prepilin signal peptidase PulO-like enzyme (type II secretory pathway)
LQFIVLGTYLFFVGACLASFLQVVATRLPKGQSLLGRSACSFCHHKLSWLDLVPIISFIALKGRCRYCHRRISVIHPLFETLVGFIFWLFIHRAGYQFSIETAIILVIVLLALTLSLSDYYYQIIPDEFLIIMFSLGLYLNYLTLNEHIIGILGGTTIFLLLHYLSRGRAMGYGDVKLVFVMAVILPSFYLAWSLYLAFLTGGIISVILILLTRKKLKSTISFGPFLGFGLVSLLWFLV